MPLIKRIADAFKRHRDGGNVAEKGRWKAAWQIEKYRTGESAPYAVEEIDGNLLLTEGITAIWTLLIGGAETAFSNANARLGVGNSNTAASAGQTGLQGASQTYKGMDVGYPQVSGAVVTFKATFGPSDANFAWQEFTADNGAVALKNLNRKVESHGTKSNLDTWVLTMTVTLT